MYCSRCGTQLAPGAAYCSSCGAPTAVTVGDVESFKRPGLVTVLAVLQLISASIWLLVTLIGGAIIGTSSQGEFDPAVVTGTTLVGLIGLVQLFCGIGLLKLK